MKDRFHILAINGSRRRNGNTSRVLGLLEAALRKTAEVEIVFESVGLADQVIEPCTGCRACFERGETACPCHDDLLAIHRKILAADCVILASPTYVNDVSGTMKTFIDRLAFVCHRPSYMRAPFFVLATTGSSPVRHAIRTLQSAVMSWGAPLIGSAGVRAGALSTVEAIAAEYAPSIRRWSKKIVRAIRSSSHERPGFFSLMTFAIQQYSWRKHWQTHDTDNPDYRYWYRNGWFDRATTFTIPHRAPRLRVFAARTIGILIARILS